MKTADRLAQSVTGHGLSRERKKKAGPIVHYAYGTGIGALYGGAASRLKQAAAGFDAAYGMAVWALGDEIAVPALKLAGVVEGRQNTARNASTDAWGSLGVRGNAQRRAAIRN